MLQKIKPELIKIFVFLGLSWLLINVTSRFYQHDDKNEDVYYIYLEGKRIIDGENPYERILEGDMRINKKYPTYFPLFYLFAAGTQLIGFREFDQWIVLWRTINILIGILITWLVLNGLSKRAGLLAGILGAVFWQFHALSLYVFEVAHIDFLAIFFLLWSLIELDKNPVRSMMLLGISLAFKQIAIFLIPLYFIHDYLERKKIWRSIHIGIVPLLVSIPFLILNAKAYIYSIFFSTTRMPASHFGTFTLSEVYRLEGMLSIVPMCLLMGLVYYIFYQRHIRIYLASFLILEIFVGFNTISFKQYMLWPLLLIPFLIIEFKDYQKDRIQTS